MKRIVMVLVGMAMAIPAWAQGPGPGPGPGACAGGPCAGGVPGGGPGGRGPGPGRGMGPGHGMGPGAGMGMGRDVLDPEALEGLAADVGVDAATLARIKSLVYAANREAIDLRAEVQRQRLALRQLLEDERPDVKKVLKQVEAVGAAETGIRKNRVQLILGVRDLLTPEQRQKLQRILAERRGAMRGAGPAWGAGDLD